MRASANEDQDEDWKRTMSRNMGRTWKRWRKMEKVLDDEDDNCKGANK
jgi:hypothetical protein